MRPDEHKKKKSAQYKKKHGAQASKGDDGRNNERQTNRDGSGTSQTQGAAARNYDTKSDNNCKANQQDQLDAEENHRSFSKRTVQSNWERYELSDHGSSDEERGADFNVLLSFAGTSSSYKQLESEKEWTEADTGEFSSLGLDCQDLEAAFKDLPFREKYKLGDLGLDSDILEYLKAFSDEGFTPEAQPTDILSRGVADDMGFDFSGMHKATENINDTQESTENDNETQASENMQLDDGTSDFVTQPPALKAGGEIHADSKNSSSGECVKNKTETIDIPTKINTHKIHIGNNDNKNSDHLHCDRERIDSSTKQIDLSSHSQPSTIQPSAKKADTELDDAALDDLLTLTSPASDPAGTLKKAEPPNVECSQAQPPLVQTETKEAIQADNDPDADDLESWLDSVL